MMPADPDFRHLVAAFNAARVKYPLVGGDGRAFHGRPRFTKDLDVWLEPVAENAKRASGALEAFGAQLHALSAGDPERLGLIFQIGVAPNRIGVLKAIDGVTFAAARADRQETRYSDQRVPAMSRHHLAHGPGRTG